MAAVIHHGGAGTTHHSVRAGVQSIIVPFFANQAFWRSRVKETWSRANPEKEIKHALLGRILRKTAHII